MPLRLLCLTAHPDDESGAFAGALLRSAARGVETSVLCLTDGAAGNYREPGQTDEQLAAQRREEFAQASAVLRVGYSELLRYRDGALAEEPFLPLVEALVRVLRRLRPHVVLTFGAEGGVNLHKDHTAVSLTGTAAFHWAARPGWFPARGEPRNELKTEPRSEPWAAQKLYYAATPFLSSRDEHIQATGTRTPATLRYTLDPETKERKLEAFRRHGSQGGLLAKVQADHGDIFAEEHYLLAAARNPVEGERDMWDGVVEEG